MHYSFKNYFHCNRVINPLLQNISCPDTCSYLSTNSSSLEEICNTTRVLEMQLSVLNSYSVTEGMYSLPMELIGMYIALASLWFVVVMAWDVFDGFKRRRYWFPAKMFSMNSAIMTILAVVMKLPVDLTSPMPSRVDQIAKFGGVAYMCTVMCNFMPSLVEKSLLENIIGLAIFVITLVVNGFIQVTTRVIAPPSYGDQIGGLNSLSAIIGMQTAMYTFLISLLFLVIISISLVITTPKSMEIIEAKYQTLRKKTLNDQHLEEENHIDSVESLRKLVERSTIMAESRSPQFVMAYTPLSCATGVICAINMVVYISTISLLWSKWSNDCHLFFKEIGMDSEGCDSVYKRSTILIAIIQTIGILLGSIAPICRCLHVSSFRSISKNLKQFAVFKVEDIWTRQMYEWKIIRLSLLSSVGPRSRASVHGLKNIILIICIGFQKIVVVSCKVIGLVPIGLVNFVQFSVYYLKPTGSNTTNTNEELSNYVLLIEGDTQLAQRTANRIANYMKCFNEKAEKKQHGNLLNLLGQLEEQLDASTGVVTFDNGQFRSKLLVEPVNSWSLPIVSLTCIVVAIPNIPMDLIDNMFKSVAEGLLYTHVVEEYLNREAVYVNIRKATVDMWHEIEENHMWLNTTLKRSAYQGKTPREVLQSFANKAQEIMNTFSASTGEKTVEMENLPAKVILANSMFRVANTVMHAYDSEDSEITEHELFNKLSSMISQIIAACLTNLPRVIRLKCDEKTLSSVAGAADLLGKTSKIIDILERRAPNMDQEKMSYIDEWRLHLRRP